MTDPRESSVDRVRNALGAFGHDATVRTFDKSTRTAAEAAAAIGCEVAQIAKSLIFRGLDSDRAVLVIARGDRRVDETKIAAALGEPIGRADPDFVRARTGFAIGGVAPVGHIAPVATFIDGGLKAFATVWAAAGAPNAVFETTADKLAAMTGGGVIDIA